MSSPNGKESVNWRGQITARHKIVPFATNLLTETWAASGTGGGKGGISVFFSLWTISFISIECTI